VKALIKELKLSPSEEAKLTSCVLEGDWQALRLAAESCKMPDVSRLLSSLLSLKGKTSGFLQNVRTLSQQASQDFKSSLEDFTNIATLLDRLGCSYEIDITAIRGFEYYTGACFQLSADGERIAGGGRYDNLVPFMNGGNIPACGFALYVDPTMKLLPPEEKGKSDILVKGEGLSPEIIEICFTLAGSLRDAGHPTELDFTGREESSYRWVVMVSGGEPSAFVLIDRQTKRQRKVASTAEILKVLGKR
jgi:histidyl-tRNA synthetase